MTTSRRIIKNTFFFGFSEMGGKVLSFIFAIYIARTLGVDGVGKLDWTKAILAYFALIMSGGFDAYGIRQIARRKEDIKEYVSHIFTIRILIATFLYVGLIFFTLFINKPLDIKKILLFYGLTLFTGAFSLVWVFTGLERMEYVALNKMLNQIFCLVGVLVLIHNEKQILRVPLIEFITGASVMLLLFIIYVREFGFFRFTVNFDVWGEIFKASFPVGLAAIMVQLYNNFDTIMLGFIRDEATVGWYNAAYKIMSLISCVGGFHLPALFPVIARYYKESEESKKKVGKILSILLKTACIVSFPIAVGGVIMAEPIMGFIYGRQFLPGAIALQILIWNVIFIWLNAHYGSFLLACDKQKNFMWAVTFGGITNVILNIIFIPKYGMVAAGITTLHFPRLVDS